MQALLSEESPCFSAPHPLQPPTQNLLDKHSALALSCVFMASCLHSLSALTAAATAKKTHKEPTVPPLTLSQVSPGTGHLLALSSVSCLRVRCFCSRTWRYTVVSITKNMCHKPQYWTSKAALECTYTSFWTFHIYLIFPCHQVGVYM